VKCKVISLEGIWGAGKSTLSKSLACSLKNVGYKVSFIHYGIRANIGKLLEQELDFVNPVRVKTGKGGFERDYHAFIEILLRYAREYYDQQHFITPQFAANDIIILDRGIDTITAYALAILHSTYSEKSMDEWYEWIKNTTGFWSCESPDLTIFLSLDWEYAVQRAEKRDKTDYGLERKTFLPMYVNAFEYIAQREERIVTIDINEKKREWVLEAALKIISNHLNHEVFGEKIKIS